MTDALTPETRMAFLTAMAASGGNVTKACNSLKISREVIYNWRAKDPEFAAAWERAKQLGLEGLEDEAVRRAFSGFDEKVFFNVHFVDTITRYSDTLMICLLKGGKPEKYRERVQNEISVPNGGPVAITLQPPKVDEQQS